MMRGRRDERERIRLREHRVAHRAFARRHVVRERIASGRLLGLRVELALARGCGEVAFRKWRPFRGDVEPDRRLTIQPFDGDSLQARVRPVEGLFHQGLIVFEQTRIDKAHVPGKLPEDLGVRPAFSERLYGGPIDGEVQVTVRLQDVGVFEHSGCGQHDVGPVHGVGAEELVYRDEQVFAREAAAHVVLIGSDRGRVRVVDVERLDRRVEARIEGFAQGRHVDGARPRSDHLGPGQPRGGLRERARGRELDAAAHVPPVADESGQTGDEPDRVTAARRAVEAVVDADGRRTRRRVLTGELLDRLGAQARFRRRRGPGTIPSRAPSDRRRRP